MDAVSAPPDMQDADGTRLTEAKPAKAPEHDTFGAILAGLNPLQHLPIVGMIYRAVTGEQIDPGWRLAGSVVTGFLTGGPIGVITSLLGVCGEELLHKLTHDPPNGPTSDAPATQPAAAARAITAYQATAQLAGDMRGGMG